MYMLALEKMNRCIVFNSIPKHIDDISLHGPSLQSSGWSDAACFARLCIPGFCTKSTPVQEHQRPIRPAKTDYQIFDKFSF